MYQLKGVFFLNVDFKKKEFHSKHIYRIFLKREQKVWINLRIIFNQNVMP